MKIDLRIEKSKNCSELLVKGDLTVQHAIDFKAQLQKLYGEEGDLQLSLKGTSSIDVSGLQLVRSFKQFVASSHRDLQVIPPDSTAIIELLAKAGLFFIVQTEANLKFNTKQK